ncbi:MAG: hypothetical protein IJZ22_06465 [Bacteroidaceae bacterium]|nr:hypothetical protein [Bacteroidaceae bacterium]
MDKFMSLSQLAMSVFMFLGTITWGIAHLIKGTIGLFGFCVVLLFVYLIWILVRESYREYQQEKNK